MLLPYFLLFLVPMVLSNKTLCYLEKFGYMKKDGMVNNTEEAIKLLQETFGLVIDGTLNSQTTEFIGKPRCGNADEHFPFSANPSIKWHKNTISWFMFGENRYDNIIERAFQLWSNHSNLTFVKRLRNPDIILTFGRGQHMYYAIQDICPYDLDGRGNVLAHAFKPQSGNNQTDIHFDIEEDWDFSMDLPSQGKISFYLTCVHEIGHALGLSHSYVNTSIMWPVFEIPRGILTLNEYDLDRDDIRAIQFLYGPPATTTTTSTTTTSTTTTSTTTTTAKTTTEKYEKKTRAPNLCTLRRNINTFLVVNNRLYIFYHQYVWNLDINDLGRHVDPQLIRDWLPFIHQDIKAIYQRPNEEIAIFVENDIYYIQYPDLTLIRKLSATTLLGRKPSKINAVLNTNTGKTFIFIDDTYVLEINECTMRSKLLGFTATTFPGITDALIGGFRYINGRLYFLTPNNVVLEYNEYTRSVTGSYTDVFEIFQLPCMRDTLLNQLYKLIRYLN